MSSLNKYELLNSINTIHNDVHCTEANHIFTLLQGALKLDKAVALGDMILVYELFIFYSSGPVFEEVINAL